MGLSTRTLLWIAIAAMAVGTYALRLSFILVLGRAGSLRPRVERVLNLVPAAVLAALVAPALLTVDGSIALSSGNERLVAGTLAGVVAWHTENMMATVAAGMAVLWTLQFLL